MGRLPSETPQPDLGRDLAITLSVVFAEISSVYAPV
jgi:hypothetical protein